MVAKWYPRGRTVPNASKPWYERGNGERFRREDAIVRSSYPALDWRIDSENQLAHLEGAITLLEPGEIHTRISTRVTFQPDHPASEPLVFETGGRFVRDDDHHIGGDGRCCLWLPPLSKWDSERPQALCEFLDEVAVFFDRQLIFEATGRWPGPSWEHGPPGYWQFIVESLGKEEVADTFLVGLKMGRGDICPCGSGRRFKRCHLPQFDTLRYRIDPFELKRVLEWRERTAPETNMG